MFELTEFVGELCTVSLGWMNSGGFGICMISFKLGKEEDSAGVTYVKYGGGCGAGLASISALKVEMGGSLTVDLPGCGWKSFGRLCTLDLVVTCCSAMVCSGVFGCEMW